MAMAETVLPKDLALSITITPRELLNSTAPKLNPLPAFLQEVILFELIVTFPVACDVVVWFSAKPLPAFPYVSRLVKAVIVPVGYGLELVLKAMVAAPGFPVVVEFATTQLSEFALMSCKVKDALLTTRFPLKFFVVYAEPATLAIPTPVRPHTTLLVIV
jgi:hypothetical protein